MPAPSDFPTGAPLWMDLSTRDVDGARAFYTGLFGWTMGDTPPEFGGYVTISLGGRQIGGLTGNREPDAIDDAWLVYLETDDAETTAQAITGASGVVHLGPHPVGDLGSMVVAEDTGRAAIAAWQRGTNGGFQVLAEPGAPAWFELHTVDYDDSLTFYQQAFGWQTNSMADTPEFRYSQLMVDEQPYAGVMDAKAYWEPGAPAKWFVYINVADADATMTEAVALGGRVVDAPEDTPFGRMGMLADPTGALIKIVT